MFWEMVNLFCMNYETLLTAGISMACMLIVLIGLFKPLYNKIKNQYFRGFLLSLTNVLGAFAFVAVAFWCNSISFEYYWFTAVTFCIFTVFVYWLYENFTQARAGVKAFGTFAWERILPFIRNKIDLIIQGLNDTKAIANTVDSLITKNTKNGKNEKATAKNEFKGL